MSFQSSANKMLGSVAGVLTAAKIAEKEKETEATKQHKAEETQKLEQEKNAKKQKLEQEKIAKQKKAEEEGIQKGRIEKASALLKAQKTEQSLISQYTKGLAINNAAARRQFIHSQFDYETLRSNKISPLEFQANYLENLDNLGKKLADFDASRNLKTMGLTKKMNLKHKKGGKK